MILDPGEVLYSLKNLSNGFPHVSPKGRTISINMQILFDRSNEWLMIGK